MGEVYRARDTRLERTVAIKILPQQLSSDPVRKQRFEREAKTISSLNHPNICTLHDIGSQDGVDYLVMECVEGETLAKRLEKGPLPLEQVLKFGAQVADALDRAHRAGIVHRDLKPGNIMLTANGAKLLDFGLAKPAAPLVSGMTLTSAPQTTPVTQEGTVVGTFQYMSPEQVEGKELDGRSDIFSLGAVLYEMLTGQRAFQGKSQLSVASAILEKEPAPISSLKPLTPPSLDHAIRRCLAKDPEERWQTARDLALELKWIVNSQASVPAPLAQLRKNRERLTLVTLSVASAAALILGVLYLRRPSVQARVFRSSIRPAANSSFVLTGSEAGFALSPDGGRLAYVAVTPDRKTLLWIRPIDSLQAEPLAGTENAAHPFWSPDGRFIGFFADGKLKKIEASGGPPATLCDASLGRGGTWNRDGVILFAPGARTPIYRVSASGGTATPVTTPSGDMSNRWPYFLPDGRHFLYLSGTGSSPKDSPTNALLVGSLDSQESKLLFRTHANAVYVAGHILFLRQNTLMAQPFDAKRLELAGEAFPIAEHVEEDDGRIFGVFSASENGVLTYADATSGTNRQLAWFDRSGKPIGVVPGMDLYADPEISPDGKRLSFRLEPPGDDIWIYDIARGIKTRLTFGAAVAQPSYAGVWSPDGQRIAYATFRNGKLSLYQRPSDGSGSEELLVEGTSRVVYPSSWSPDGKFLAYYEPLQVVNTISMVPMSGERKPTTFLQSQFIQLAPRFSPDGKWIAYCSGESGRTEVDVVAFPVPGRKWQVSTEGGCSARWRRDGREIFYLAPDSKIMAVEVRTSGPNFEIGAVRPLFQTKPYRGGEMVFDVTADGQRFIVNYSEEQPSVAITLVVNWTEELKKK